MPEQPRGVTSIRATELILTARAEAEGAVSIGFGECRGVVWGASA